MAIADVAVSLNQGQSLADIGRITGLSRHHVATGHHRVESASSIFDLGIESVRREVRSDKVMPDGVEVRALWDFLLVGEKTRCSPCQKHVIGERGSDGTTKSWPVMLHWLSVKDLWVEYKKWYVEWQRNPRLKYQTDREPLGETLFRDNLPVWLKKDREESCICMICANALELLDQYKTLTRKAHPTSTFALLQHAHHNAAVSTTTAVTAETATTAETAEIISAHSVNLLACPVGDQCTANCSLRLHVVDPVKSISLDEVSRRCICTGKFDAKAAYDGGFLPKCLRFTDEFLEQLSHDRDLGEQEKGKEREPSLKKLGRQIDEEIGEGINLIIWGT